MPRLNVVHITEQLKTGGQEQVIAMIAAGLDQREFSVKVCVFKAGGEIFECLRQSHISVETLGLRSDRDIPGLLRFARRLKADNIQVIHTHGHTADTLGRIAAWLAGVPVIITHMHNTYRSHAARQLIKDRLLSRITDRIICCSQAVARAAVEKGKIPPGKIQVVYNGIDDKKFSPGQNSPKHSPDFIVGCVASLQPHKGQRYLLEAVSLLSGYAPNIRVVFAGEGPLRNELEAAAGQLGIADRVEFKGMLGDIPGFLRQCDVVVLPSAGAEGLPLSLLEAMSCGKPVVASDTGGIPEIIEPGVTGMLVPARDGRALAEALRGLRETPLKSAEIGRQARRAVEQRFSLSSMLIQIETLYRTIYENKAKRSL
jgi:Glycosyltransferase